MKDRIFQCLSRGQVRQLSITVPVSREFKHVVSRRVAAPRTFAAGDAPPSARFVAARKAAGPPYPYGEATSYKQSNRGLYGGKVLQFGHKVSEWGNKNTRIFRPNVQRVTLWSEVLKRSFRLRVVTSVLRSITREGGLDNYLQKDSPARIKELGPTGWQLRYQVLKRIEEHERTLAKPITVADGVPIYAELERNGVKFGVSVGRTRLLKLLLQAQPQRIPLRRFMESNKTTSFSQLLDSLENHGVDINPFLKKI